MKKRLMSTLTALLCMTSLSTGLQTSASDSVLKYTLVTDTFAYANNNAYGYQNGFLLETDLVDADFMVVGMQYYEDHPDELFGYLITPINCDWIGSGGLGILYTETVTHEIGDQQLRVGDLLHVDGDYGCADIYPTLYNFDEATLSYVGYGVDIFGDAFLQVIRSQLVVEQAEYDYWKDVKNGHMLYDISLIKGDVNANGSVDVLDCIVLNKHLLGVMPICDYGRVVSDMNQDNEVDIFDLALLKRELINK
ncbi:MAG: dockerin type I repeat-containing protein [Oscillospiraceae bacterium]|nr:dockerin type I repeat-containing protein [Oscillospiraceae bacterium]